MGKTILEETISGLLRFSKNISEISLVIAPRDLDRAKELFGKEEKVRIYIQEEPNGAGQGLLKVFNKNFSGSFFLTTGDKINAAQILEKLKGEDQAVAIRKTDEPEHFGIVELDSKKNITSVIEKPAKGKEPSSYKITSAYLLDSTFLKTLSKFEKEHYSLEAALNKYVKENQVKGVFVDDVPDTRLKFPWDLLDINQKLQGARRSHFVHDLAQISKTAVIEGPVYIDKNARIADFVKIVGPVYIGPNAVIGDFSLVRNGSFIDQGAVIGAHSEIKNSIVYQGASVHRSYIGDSVIDSGARIGGGVVFANKRYDREVVKSVIKGEKLSTGLKAFGAVLGFSSSVGTNATLMPGVKIGNKAIVWPGKVVLEDLKDDQTLK